MARNKTMLFAVAVAVIFYLNLNTFIIAKSYGWQPDESSHSLESIDLREKSRTIREALDLFVDSTDPDMIKVMEILEEQSSASVSASKAEALRAIVDSEGRFTGVKYTPEDNDVQRHTDNVFMLCQYDINTKKALSPECLRTLEFIDRDLPLLDTNKYPYLFGIPQRIIKTLLVARTYLKRDLIINILNRYFRDVPEEYGPVWNHTSTSGRLVGGNMGPRAKLGVQEGILRDNLMTISKEVKGVFIREIIDRNTSTGGGLRPDGCLHQHNLIVKNHKTNVVRRFYQIYATNYGKEFLRHVSFLLYLFDGTKFDFGSAVKEGFFAAFKECQIWLFRGHTVEPTTTGRFISSGHLVTYTGGRDSIYKTLTHLEKIGYHKDEIQGLLKRYDNFVPDEESALVGNKFFFSSDMMAHHRREYMGALRLLSNRTCRPETWATHNIYGYYLGDGFLTVLVNGLEYGIKKKEVFQVYDWARIPGVTTLYTTHVPAKITNKAALDHAYNDSPFVGGASNGMDGVSAMVYNRKTVTVKGRKSWHFLDDNIICIGTGLTDEDNDGTKTMITTLNQVARVKAISINSGGVETEYGVDITEKQDSFDSNSGAYVHHDEVGYLPLGDNGKLNVNVTSPSDKCPVFSLWLDHGIGASQESYAYAVLPAKTSAETAAYSINNQIEVLSRENNIHAVCRKDKKVVSIVFFEVGCIDTGDCLTESVKVCVDSPSIVIVDHEYTASVAEPTQMLTTLGVSLTKDGSENYQTVNLPIDKYGGASVQIKFVI